MCHFLEVFCIFFFYNKRTSDSSRKCELGIWCTVMKHIIKQMVLMLFSRNIPPSPSPTESKILFCISVSLFLFCISRVKQITSPDWMHETSARGWCTGKTLRNRVEREVGGGIGMGNTCKSMADSCQCMTKTTTIL